MFSLKGKVAVVTGGARGLGYEMMLGLAEQGASVACVDLVEQDSRNACMKLKETSEVDTSFWGCNVADNEAVIALFKDILGKHGQIDILVTAAGINKVCPAIDYAPEDFTNIFKVNVNGTFYCMQQAAKIMMDQKRGGSIITIASMSAHIVNHPQQHAPYNASKAAVLQLTKSLACEWAPQKIRVNAISPGYFDTVMNQTILAQQGQAGITMRKFWEEQTPMGRLGIPHELKGAVVFLASDSASYVSGTEIRVDGAYTAW